MRRGAIVRLVTLGVVLGLGATALALFVPWLPGASSEQADGIDFVFWFTTAICIVIFAVVAAIAIYSVYEVPRAAGRRHGRPADPRPHGHRDRLDRRPVVLVTAIAIVSAVALAKNDSCRTTTWS